MGIERYCEVFRRDGYCILPKAFDAQAIRKFRKTVIRNLNIMGRTRSLEHSRHLAGFHRFPKFAEIHSDILGNNTIRVFLNAFYGPDNYASIGLSDITINRSQVWHTDLLRDRFAHHLNNVDPWAKEAGTCLKVLVYLQPGKSLRIVRGSHLKPTPLSDTRLSEIAEQSDVTQLSLESGDAVMMDLRLIHRGASDSEMQNPDFETSQKILLSTVLGDVASDYCKTMENGNLHRMTDWDLKFLKFNQDISK